MKTILVLSTMFWAGLFAQTEFAPMTINDWTYWQGNNGSSAHSPFRGGGGGFFLQSGPEIIDTDGLVWAGKVQDPDPHKPQLRAGGMFYRVSTVPGWIETAGTESSPPIAVAEDHPRLRLYRVRRDFDTAADEDLIWDVAKTRNIDPDAVTTAMIDTLRKEYQQDWLDWPINLGAPWYDRNRNDQWDPDFDEPGIADADQVIWYVVNDLNPSRTQSTFGSPPTGLEIQVTVWAYKNDKGPLGDMVFKRYRIFNKSGFRIDSLFFGHYSNTDIGDYGDDLSGCDSAMSMVYSYNSAPYDDQFHFLNLPTPAVASVIVQGPLVPAPGKTAMLNFEYSEGYRNLPLTSAWIHATGSSIGYPTMGVYGGTLELFWNLQGYIAWARSDSSVSHAHFLQGSGPEKGQPTTFWLSGDPLSGIGDIDNVDENLAPGSRSFFANSGPVSMAPGDMQEIVFAIVGGISTNDQQPVYAVADVKALANVAHNYYQNLVNFEAPQGARDTTNQTQESGPDYPLFMLAQNYPNPFNHATIIRTRLLQQMEIQLDILNVLGQVVRSVYRGLKDRGDYNFQWDGKDKNGRLLSSGVYFARMQSKSLIQWRKMIYVK